MRTIISSIALILFTTTGFGQPLQSSLQITHLTGDFYIFKTFNIYKGKPVPANGMYVVTNDGVIMLDTPWDTTQFQPLLDSIKFKHHKDVKMCISTHFHDDRTYGLEYFKHKGIKTYTTERTDDISKTKNSKRAEFLIDQDTVFRVGQYSFQTYYAGPGHSPDNIVIWFDKDKILYGGCLIKSTEATNIGNLSDANLQEWPNTIRNIQQKFRDPKFIIPGHDSWADIRSLEHTLELIRAHNDKTQR